LKAVRYYPLDEPNLPQIGSQGYVRHPDYVEWLTKYKSQADTSIIMRLLHSSLEKSEAFDELKTLLGSKGLNVIEKINIMSHNPINTNNGDKSSVFYLIEFLPSLSSGSGMFNYQELSFGTRRLVRILVSIIYDNSTVLLLEQPEDGIHTGVLHKLIPLLKSYTGQFLIASHSSEIFNRMEPEEIRLVTMENGVTQLRPLDATEIAAASRFIREEGTLSDFIETIQED
jgi:AAA15 family ATPase/GTPase